MGKLKKGAAAVGGVVVGIVTLRALRKRRSGSDEDEEIEAEVEKAETELKTAAEHATAAVEHAGVAAKKTIEARREKAE